MPDPSPMTKPSLFLSNGRLALLGSSFLVDNALAAQNPPMPRGVITDSVPPAIITSASPLWIILYASPIAFVPVAQAVTTHELGPFAPNLMDICPDARFAMSIGIKKGEILLTPSLRYIS